MQGLADERRPVTRDPERHAAAWDARVDNALARAPDRLRRAVVWLRHPPRRWIRLPAGVLFVVGGIFSILPILGLWMLPLGLALLSEDIPPLKGWLERAALWAEGLWRRWRG